jgi:hypothetical protein
MILGLHSLLFLTKVKAATAIISSDQAHDPLIKLCLTAYRSFHHGFLTVSNRHDCMICLTGSAGRADLQLSIVDDHLWLIGKIPLLYQMPG